VITDPLFYLVAIPAVLLVGLAKGGFGGALTLVGVPLMAVVISPVTAAAIMLPVLVAMDIVGLVAWRGTFDRRVIAIMLPASFGGVLLGYLTATMVSADGIRLVIGLLALWFAAEWFWRSRHQLEPRPRKTVKSLSWGAIAGFSSFVSHAGGPPFQVAVMPLRLPPPVYAGTSVLFFASTNAVKLIPYFLLGQFSADNLATSAVLMPLAPVATLAGVWLVRRVDPKAFYWIAYMVLVPVGLKLIVDGARALFF